MRILQAHNPAQLRPLLAQLDAAMERGQFAYGMLAFEAAAAFDCALAVHHATGPAPLAWFALYDDPPAAFAPPPAAPWALGQLHPGISRARYAKAMARLRCAIRAGDVYQVNFSYPLQAAFHGSALDFFLHLQRWQASPWNGFIETDDWALASLSPECFFARDGQRITVAPMKGTMAPAAGAARRLAASVKDRAENLMIVDMMRNDLSRLPAASGVRSGPLMQVREYPTVVQMTSRVRCRARASLAQLFAALFPCASVTGAPKVAAMRQIHSLESGARGPYCGAIGWAYKGRARFSVAIRTALICRHKAQLRYGVGGGIVSDSRTMAEWRETRTKAAILRRRPTALIETMRAEEGRIALLALHLERLAHSAAQLDFALDIAEVRAAILRRLAAAPGYMRLRLRLRPDGRATLRAGPLPPPPRRPLRLHLLPASVRSADPLLRHKTDNRALYDRARAEARAAGADDALLCNERGQLTETCIGNLALQIGGTWYTPPLHCGLLPGTLRAQMLARGQLQERPLHPADLPRATAILRINALRGPQPAVIQ